MDNHVEAYVDGELSGEELETFEEILEDDEHWRTQVHQAERIQGALRDLPQPSAPPELTRSILDQTSRTPQGLPWWKETLQQMMQAWRAIVAARRRPTVDYAVGMAFVAVAIVFIVWPLTQTDSPSEPPTQVSSQLEIPVTAPYNEQDVERARTKAEWTFEYISRISQPVSTAPADTPSAQDPVPNVIPNDSTRVLRFRDTP